MRDDDLYVNVWQSLYEEAVRLGFPTDRAEVFADANADSVFQARLRDRLDETVQAMRRTG
jgi:hypothetical protein